MSSNDENKVNNAKVLNSKENAELNCKLRWLGIGFQDFWNICVCENCVVGQNCLSFLAVQIWFYIVRVLI